MNKVDYYSYIKSDKWKKKRKKYFKKYKSECVLCNAKSDLNIHHLTYKRLGHEWLRDLVSLCSNCHTNIAHNKSKSDRELKALYIYLRKLKKYHRK